jgi:hypothetical protein
MITYDNIHNTCNIFSRNKIRRKASNMSSETMPRVGQKVIFHDPVGTAHEALVTAVWGPYCINLVYVSSDDTKKDQYGRQMERQTSCSKGGPNTAYGNYWRFEEDEVIPVRAAVEI